MIISLDECNINTFVLWNDFSSCTTSMGAKLSLTHMLHSQGNLYGISQTRHIFRGVTGTNSLGPASVVWVLVWKLRTWENNMDNNKLHWLRKKPSGWIECGFQEDGQTVYTKVVFLWHSMKECMLFIRIRTDKFLCGRSCRYLKFL